MSRTLAIPGLRTTSPRGRAPVDGRRWWSSLGHRRLAVAVASTVLAVPIVVLDNLPDGPRAAEAELPAAGTHP